MVTENAKARKSKYKNSWIAENKERINLVVDKGRKSQIKAHADKTDGGSVNAFINRAIGETMQRDGEQ